MALLLGFIDKLMRREKDFTVDVNVAARKTQRAMEASNRTAGRPDTPGSFPPLSSFADDETIFCRTNESNFNVDTTIFLIYIH